MGSSIAGIRTAQNLRAQGYEPSITIVGEEHALPYDKPPLSKGFLTGEARREDLELITSEQVASLGISLRLGEPATSLDLEQRTVTTGDGTALSFESLVVATGARPRWPAWADVPGVNQLRTIKDAEAIARDLRIAKHVAVIGAGFVGGEIAAAARRLGCSVSLIDPLPIPMGRLLTDAIGQEFVDLQRAHGVEVIFGLSVVGIARTSAGYELELSDGRRLESEAVVVGVGVTPNTEWLDGSGLVIDDGVVCDQYCRALVDTGGVAAGVFAVGDVARWFHPRKAQLTRVEHWTNAIEQARIVAQNMTHPAEPVAHDSLGFVWSDQYDWKTQISGDTTSTDVVVQRSGDRFAALYAEGGVLVGSVVVNWPRISVAARAAIGRGDSREAVLSKVLEANVA